jgi:hypothetical protein
MTVANLKIGSRSFVVLPKKDYLQMQRKLAAADAQDARDVAKSRRRKAEGPSRPYSTLRRELGLT